MRGLVSLQEEEDQSSLSQPCEDSNKAAICKPESEPPEDREPEFLP